jgi:hypothetical protein
VEGVARTFEKQVSPLKISLSGNHEAYRLTVLEGINENQRRVFK